jgi:hypothetical protein
MKNKPINKSKTLTGVIGPQSMAEFDRVSLFTDNENEYPILPDHKGQRLAKLIGQRVKIDGHLEWDYENKDMVLRVDHFEFADLEEFDPVLSSMEPALSSWELLPAYA